MANITRAVICVDIGKSNQILICNILGQRSVLFENTLISQCIDVELKECDIVSKYVEDILKISQLFLVDWEVLPKSLPIKLNKIEKCGPTVSCPSRLVTVREPDFFPAKNDRLGSIPRNYFWNIFCCYNSNHNRLLHSFHFSCSKVAPPMLDF